MKIILGGSSNLFTYVSISMCASYYVNLMYSEQLYKNDQITNLNEV